MSILSRILGLDEIKRSVLDEYTLFKELLTIRVPSEDNNDVLKEILSLYGINVDEKTSREEMLEKLTNELKPKKRG
ncbi:hypothetical protein [Stygiolobus caldivivus]|uniref:Uncharacterized protein n=1 Tax=Stygiolobus caldivivus TaxID=2824673 RepID=A0A8D5U3X9_9CREN|nr:hypothetical protein [Stygiolobus caldivivus]BCU68823.1 hypothetical protein KN1_01200 [Stygiolobus caldivivus]